MAEALHSKWSASGFEAVMFCPGKKVMEGGKPNSTSKYAAEGTVAHLVFTWCLTNGLPAHHYVGAEHKVDGFDVTVTDDMAAHVQRSVDYVLEIKGTDGELWVDQRVDYSTALGVSAEDGWGTLDAAVVVGSTLYSIDLKFGMGVLVEAGHDVDAGDEQNRVCKPNPQLALYALGMLANIGDLVDIEDVVLAIAQPRVTPSTSEYKLSATELHNWASTTARSAVITAQRAEEVHQDQNAWAELFLRPGEKQCKFCKAKATCPALRAEVVSAVGAEGDADSIEAFEDLTVIKPTQDRGAAWLGACLSKVDLIEDWCAAVRGEALRRLTAGDAVPGYKLVQGKRGSRAWTNGDDAEKQLKAFGLKVDEMYDLKVISPTSAEKLAKAKAIGPRQWPKLQALITQPDGKPSVAPASDPRPAMNVQPIGDVFENLADKPAYPSVKDEASVEDLC